MDNCLVVGVGGVDTNSIDGVSNVFLDSDAGVFQTVGAGANYLATNSPYRNAGTTNIDPTLLASLRQKTTYPPNLLTGAITNTTVLSPAIQRDTDTPDIGYHYDPIDYLVDNLAITNATLTLTNGVALATYNETGIRLQTWA